RGARIGRERAPRGGDGCIHIRLVAHRHSTGDALGGGIHDVAAIAAARVDPRPVDVELRTISHARSPDLSRRRAGLGPATARIQLSCGTQAALRPNSDRYLVVLQPPSTTMVWPLMKLPPGEHRNATVLAISSIVPSRVCGVISTFMRRKPSSCRRPSVIGVTVTPGATSLARMPLAPYWQAMWRVRPPSPALAAE